MTFEIRRAQRLSASSEFALVRGRKVGQPAPECSTPFGIIGIRTFTRSFPWAPGISAQRLSASSEFAPSFFTFGRHSTICAQRLSASSEFARCWRSSRSCRCWVLNAFRHHRNSHRSCLSNLTRQSPCSTPFGIIGIRTPDRVSTRPSKPSAQRLSASSEFALPRRT